MSGVRNGDGSPVPDLFGQPADSYYHTGLPGSTGARTPGAAVPLTGSSGIPNVGIGVPLGLLLDDAGAASTTQPGQLDEGISGLGAADTADSGAGHGRAGHWKRYDWQQPDGAS